MICRTACIVLVSGYNVIDARLIHPFMIQYFSNLNEFIKIIKKSG